MSVPMRCLQCGYRGIARAIVVTDSRNATISGSERCPRCGGQAIYQAGTYDFIGDTVAAFRAPGVTRASAKAFADVVSSTAKGEITTAEALQKAESINVIFAKLFRTALSNGIPVDRLLNIISVIIAAWALYSSEVDGDSNLGELRTQTELHEMILQETQKQTAAAERTAENSRRQAEAAEKTAAESQDQTRLLRELAARRDWLQPGPERTQIPRSRAERRRAEALERKRLKKLRRMQL